MTASSFRRPIQASEIAIREVAQDTVYLSCIGGRQNGEKLSTCDINPVRYREFTLGQIKQSFILRP